MDLLILIVVVFCVVGIIGYFVRSMIKFGIVIGVAYILFHIGFIWGADEFMQKLHLDTFLKPEASQKVQDQYADFAKNRDKYGVVETDAVKKVLDDTLNNAIDEAKEKASSIDKDKLMSDLRKKLANYDDGLVKEALKEAQSALNEKSNPAP